MKKKSIEWFHVYSRTFTENATSRKMLFISKRYFVIRLNRQNKVYN